MDLVLEQFKNLLVIAINAGYFDDGSSPRPTENCKLVGRLEEFSNF